MQLEHQARQALQQAKAAAQAIRAAHPLWWVEATAIASCAPGVIACPIASGRNDPNDEVYDAVAKALSEMTDATGTPLKLLRLPSPGFIGDEDDRPIPASHMNFLIANGAVIVPTYGDARAADLVCQGLKTVFPDREIIPLPSLAILSGGGSFHCISQQEPA